MGECRITIFIIKTSIHDRLIQLRPSQIKASPAAKISASILFFMKKAPFRGQTVPNAGKRPVRDDYIRFFLPAQGRAGDTNPASALDSRPGMC